jgi:sugar/nucleoside kinase (ribokinase family)
VVPQDYSGMDALRCLLPHIDYFLPNEDESRRLTGLADTPRQIETFLAHGAGTVVISRGAEGAVAARGREQWQAEAHCVPCIDPSGSGDAFAAGIITGILNHWDMAQTLRYAAALGASASTAIGTTDGVFTSEQARVFLDRHSLPVVHSTCFTDRRDP